MPHHRDGGAASSHPNDNVKHLDPMGRPKHSILPVTNQEFAGCRRKAYLESSGLSLTTTPMSVLRYAEVVKAGTLGRCGQPGPETMVSTIEADDTANELGDGNPPLRLRLLTSGRRNGRCEQAALRLWYSPRRSRLRDWATAIGRRRVSEYYVDSLPTVVTAGSSRLSTKFGAGGGCWERRTPNGCTRRRSIRVRRWLGEYDTGLTMVVVLDHLE